MPLVFGGENHRILWIDIASCEFLDELRHSLANSKVARNRYFANARPVGGDGGIVRPTFEFGNGVIYRPCARRIFCGERHFRMEGDTYSLAAATLLGLLLHLHRAANLLYSVWDANFY
jgi:hypothetical protein